MLSGQGTLGDCRFGYVTAAPRLEKCIFSAARPVDARTSATAGRRPQSRVTRHRRRLAEPRSRPLSFKTPSKLEVR